MNKYIAIAVLSLASLLAKAQGETVIIVNYLPAISLGETADFTNNFSTRGVDFEVNDCVSEDLSVGFVSSWNFFRVKVVGETFDYNEWLVSGTQFRYTNTVPLNVNVKKYFGSNDAVPYLGVGVGTMYAKHCSKELRLYGLRKTWFDCLDEIVIASGRDKQELKANIDRVVPDELKDFIHTFKT